jgi:hypothetical protein
MRWLITWIIGAVIFAFGFWYINFAPWWFDLPISMVAKQWLFLGEMVLGFYLFLSPFWMLGFKIWKWSVRVEGREFRRGWNQTGEGK